MDSETYRYSLQASKLSFSGGELKSKEGNDSSGLGVRVVRDGRIGFAYCQDESDLKKTVEKASEASRFSRQSGFSFAPAAAMPSLAITDPSIDPGNYTGIRALVDEAREAAESGGGKSRIICSFSRETVSIENSLGLAGSYGKTVFSLYAECMLGDGFGFSYLSSTSLPRDTESVGRKAAEMAKAMQGAGRPPDGLYTVVMEPEALENITETLIPSFSGDWKRRGMTKIALGQKMFSEALTLSEDPLAGAIEARPFDDEGTPSETRPLIAQGVAKGFLYDRETAALSGEMGGGACTRSSYDSLPAISPSNLVVSPGDWEDLGELDKYIELHSAHGSHTANATTGDIGLEASSAFLVEKQGRKPIKGFMLTGNIFEMLSNIEGIEKKQKAYGSLIAPRVAFRNVRVVS
ncbi:MAG TPA: TldD/PmbA family protein [Candidatus Bilamarchaeum sp.]|nr:TldD/PmbA family protein [Candidatus Bilamarchaeum sp.]